ncbi:hypothetical protein [Haloarcula salina]|uniref:Uncharacterized protein n=1 Tax=Haloarcula salina TaxID=1429914 RepID=A0AA41G0R8_9EURY|nr:hypothetical protein [Haloarcula salina]MBV0901366.1 hypothetical protein [Haloarcula salina]
MTDRVRTALSSATDSLVRPEYTGENRCWPCTVLNVAILVLAVAAVAWLSPPAGAALALVGLALITSRGYVVPYTPRIGPAVVARLPIDAGHAGPETPPTEGGDDVSAVASGADGEAVLGALIDAGIVHGEAEIRLDDDFRAAWRDRMTELRDADLEAALEAAVPNVSAERYTWQGDPWYSLDRADLDRPSSTLSRPVALADVAAIETLTGYGLSRPVACQAARPLRQFLSACPACDSALTVGNDSCCGGFGPDGPTEVLACESCDTHVFVFAE